MHTKIKGLRHSAVLNHYGCSTYSVKFLLKPIKCDKFLFKEYFLFNCALKSSNFCIILMVNVYESNNWLF